jgi:hypothetical protein
MMANAISEPLIDEDEISSYLQPATPTVIHQGEETTTPSLSAEKLLVSMLASLAPTKTANVWTGEPWANPPSWALRGASLHSIIFRPEIYLQLEDDDEYDPICKLLNVPTEEELAKRAAAREAEEEEREAARIAAEEIASQEFIWSCIKGRETRSTKRAREKDAVKGYHVVKKGAGGNKRRRK